LQSLPQRHVLSLQHYSHTILTTERFAKGAA